MTILLAFQRENCALIASDLMLGKECDPAQTYLTPEINTHNFLPSEKFRPKEEGNLVAFAGAFDPIDIVKLSIFPIETFTKNAVDINLRHSVGSLCYVDMFHAQVYTGLHTQVLKPLEKGELWISPHCIKPERERQFRDIVDKLKTEELEEEFLEKVSQEFERVIIPDIETETLGIGGYHSQIIAPAQRKTICKNFGKLQGLPEVSLVYGLLRLV